MANRFNLFENNEDFEFWLDNNCRQCSMASCYTFKHLKKDAMTKGVTIERAEFIGFFTGKLDDICNNKNRVNEGIYSNELTDKFIYGMF